MDPTTDVIFPGAMINGESIPTGEYIPIIADRSPINISVSLQNVSGSPYRTVENPSLSSVRAAIHDIFKTDVNGKTPAQISFTMEEVHSEEQFDLAVGVNFKTPFTNVSGSFDFSDETKKSRIVVKFMQVYYTIDVDPNAKPNDFFNSIPNTDIFGSVSPLYVSTVTYGRMALFTFESEYSNTEMKAAIDATFKSKMGNEGGIEISTSYQKKIESSKMNAVIFGGAGSSGVHAIHGIEGLKQYIEEGGDYSKESPGAPLSYKMRYLKDNSMAKIILSSEYNVRDCNLISDGSWKILLKEINSVGANTDDEDHICELFGEIKYRIRKNDGTEGPDYRLWFVDRDDAKSNDNIYQDYDFSLNMDLEENDEILITGTISDRDKYESTDEKFTFNDSPIITQDELIFGDENKFMFPLNRGDTKIWITILVYSGDSGGS
jgi:thiol-activated cytolysin